jgi:hypothetical protein
MTKQQRLLVMEAFSFTQNSNIVIPTKEVSSFSDYVISPASMTKQQRL